MKVVEIFPSLHIPFSEITFRSSRSSGPGGQNVNKLETRVELLFNVRDTHALSEDQRKAIQVHLSSKIDREGTLHIVSQQSRSQWKNKREAITKFVKLLQQALRKRKKRHPTQPTRQAKDERLRQKKLVGEKKKLRRLVDH